MSRPERPSRRSQLESKLEAGRREIRALEASLRAQKARLSAKATEIGLLKAEAELAESNAEAGIFVDRVEYGRLIDKHNELVDIHNALRAAFKENYSRYEKLLEADEALVRTYNALR